MTVPVASPVSRLALLKAYCRVEAQILWRIRTPVIFVVAVPVLLSLLLGSGGGGENSDSPYRGPLGLAVMFSFMVVNYAGLALYDEHTDRTAVRQALHKPPRSVFLGGKLLPPVVLSCVQLIGFTAFAVLVGEIPLGFGMILLVPIYALLVAYGAMLGVALYNLCPGPQGFQAFTYLILICFAAVGGAIVKSDALPATSRFVGYATPHYWALRATDEIASGSDRLNVIVLSCAVLAGMTALLATVAWSRFSFETKKERAL